MPPVRMPSRPVRCSRTTSPQDGVRVCFDPAGHPFCPFLAE
jgi:hypothetical protein